MVKQGQGSSAWRLLRYKNDTKILSRNTKSILKMLNSLIYCVIGYRSLINDINKQSIMEYTKIRGHCCENYKFFLNESFLTVILNDLSKTNEYKLLKQNHDISCNNEIYKSHNVKLHNSILFCFNKHTNIHTPSSLRIHLKINRKLT